jgi:Protein of unknown function (DUF2905)
MPPGFGKLLIVAGAVLIALGVLFQLGARLPWLGRLPGDILVRREGFTFYFPLTTGILVSLALSLLLWLLRR